MTSWHPIATAPENTPVLTKIHDERGSRNEAVLERRGGLWFTTGDGVYVYYTPTHWTWPPQDAIIVDLMEALRASLARTSR